MGDKKHFIRRRCQLISRKFELSTFGLWEGGGYLLCKLNELWTFYSCAPTNPPCCNLFWLRLHFFDLQATSVGKPKSTIGQSFTGNKLFFGIFPIFFIFSRYPRFLLLANRLIFSNFLLSPFYWNFTWKSNEPITSFKMNSPSFQTAVHTQKCKNNQSKGNSF